MLAHVEVRDDEDVEAMERQRQTPSHMDFVHPELQSPDVQDGEEVVAISKPIVRDKPKVGRNEPCPCGSGKKYKQCHGKLQ